MKITSCAVFLAIATVCDVVAQDQKTREQKWKIIGQLEEACSCNPACPCWFRSKPTRPTCSGSEVLFIEKGHYGKVRLDGLAIANYAQSPEGRSMMESFGNWNFSTNYIDERATPEQRKALEAIAAVVLPSQNASSNFKTQSAPITRKVEREEHIITIGNIASFHGQLLAGGLGGTPEITNPPGADPIHHRYGQGKTSEMSYRDSGQNWNWTDSNYMFGTFTVDNEQYAKHVSALAETMANGKAKP